MQEVFKYAFDLNLDLWPFGLFCFLVYTPLCWVRKIEKFNLSHIIAIFMILLTIIVIVVFACLKLRDDGWG